MMLGDVRELVAARGIADDVDARVRRDQVLVNDATLLDAHAGSLEPEAFDVRFASRRKQQVGAGQLRRHAVLVIIIAHRPDALRR